MVWDHKIHCLLQHNIDDLPIAVLLCYYTFNDKIWVSFAPRGAWLVQIYSCAQDSAVKLKLDSDHKLLMDCWAWSGQKLTRNLPNAIVMNNTELKGALNKNNNRSLQLRFHSHKNKFNSY